MVRVKVNANSAPGEPANSRELHADDLAQLESETAALEAQAAESSENAEELLALAQRKRAVLDAHRG